MCSSDLDVTEYYFTAISTGIEEKVNPSTMSFSYTDNATIRISGSAAGEAVLYDANGKLLQRQKVSGGNTTINVASYAPGVYILNLTKERLLRVHDLAFTVTFRTGLRLGSRFCTRSMTFLTGFL